MCLCVCVHTCMFMCKVGNCKETCDLVESLLWFRLEVSLIQEMICESACVRDRSVYSRREED